jgi:hypothetical protein
MDLKTTPENYLTENGFEDILGFEGSYKINRLGMVWSCCYKKVMKVQQEESGYLYVRLKRQDGTNHKGRIHRLLGIQYIENPDNLPEIDHIDRNKKNNDLSNLRWADRFIQANNKKTNVANMTEEEQETRKLRIRERARIWAEKNRRELGMKPKITFETEEDRQAHYRNKSKEAYKRRLEEMTPEEKQEYHEKRIQIGKKSRAKRISNMSEEELKNFRQQAIQRTKKHKENQDKDKARAYNAERQRNRRKRLKEEKEAEGSV